MCRCDGQSGSVQRAAGRRYTRSRPALALEVCGHAAGTGVLLFAAVLVGSAALVLPGCGDGNMSRQPKYDPLETSDFFADGMASRHLVEGVVPRGHLTIDEHFDTGRVGGQPADTFPEPVTAALLERGQARFTIFCTPCHDQTGSGNGIVVQRGYPRPPSYHIDRLRQAPVGHFFDVMTNGFGRMPSYAAQVPPGDRWAIAAYIRSLQLSQHVPADLLPLEDRRRLDEAP
jgi:mono/diheme cytochrome c family protein